MSKPEPDEAADGGDERRLDALIAGARVRAKAEQARFAALLDKHGDRPLVDVALRTYRRDREIAGTVVGSALAFRLFLFFIPLLVFVVGVAGFLASWVDAEDVADNAGVSGGLAEQIRSAFDQPGSTRWAAVLLGLVGIVSTGRTLSKVMVASSSLAWRLPTTTKASLKVAGGLVGLIAGIGLVAVLMNRVRGRVRAGRHGRVVRRRARRVRARLAGYLDAAAAGDVRSGCPAAGCRAGGRDVDGDAGGEPALPPQPDRAGERAVRSCRHDDRDARLVLHRRAGDGRLDVPRRRGPRALRHDLTADLLAADLARPAPQIGPRETVFGLDDPPPPDP